jgi:acetyl/propionyl-CoA carboxylase alpha subunit
VRGRDLVRRAYADSESSWVRSFDPAPIKCLVVCRGPVRLEAFEIFDAIGVREYGMLLSEKDSVTYPRCLAPELRGFRFPANVHRVPDYMGVGQAEKQQRIREIVDIAVSHAYTHVFAGYGFMAEDAAFIEAIEQAGIGFMGPSSRVVRQAGAKDEAKKLARALGNSVIPGIDTVSARALLRRQVSRSEPKTSEDQQCANRRALEALAAEHGLPFTWDAQGSPDDNAEALLQAGYHQLVELVAIPELQEQAEIECRAIWREYPNHRIRFKHIGGGGGKGQRVVARPEQVAAAVMGVLAESKVLPAGSNRNFLIELNLESTRHNEIQLIGNGRWCMSLGGRDCSVQMHEQKLVEVSLTRELIDAEIGLASGKTREILDGDRGTLERMENEGARFGEAVGLDSVSTFECIVEGFDHFFMEMNTRIQVEHGVTELAYRLKFTNPDDPEDCFYIDELIEAMAVLALHGARLPAPGRVPRAVSGVEVRINATNQALQPHAGGLVRGWSRPIPGEIRFDQGIGVRNPDTGSFIYYSLAGAYDSNIALLLTDGDNRRHNYERMAEVLRCMELRGDDLQTNAPVHYGLINWFLGKGPMAEPDTRFMASYLAAVGALAQLARDVDLELAANEFARSLPDDEARAVFAEKQTLLVRPIQRLLANAHVLGGFLGRFDGVLWTVRDDEPVFADNPIRFLRELYHYLQMEENPDTPPSEKIWEDDAAILGAAEAFYGEIWRKTGTAWSGLDALFAGSRDLRLASDDATWGACAAAHGGHQLGLEILLLIPRLGVRSGFSEVGVDETLKVVFPARFLDSEKASEFVKALAPPPPASADEIVTPMGGAYYAREAPHLPSMVNVGDHFDAGQPLFIIEVMKMFNKVLAPFAGTVTEDLMAGRDGTVVAKGQKIFSIEPDVRFEPESGSARAARVRAATLALLS